MFYVSRSETHSSAVVDQHDIINAMLRCGVTISGERGKDILNNTCIAEEDAFGVVCKIIESDKSYKHEIQSDLVDRGENDMFFISDIRCYRKLNGVGEGDGFGIHNIKRDSVKSENAVSTNDPNSKLKVRIQELIRVIQNLRVQEHSDVVDVLMQGADGYFGKDEFVATLKAFGLDVLDEEIGALHKSIRSPGNDEDAFSICCAYLKEKIASSPLLRDSFRLTLVKVDDMGMIYCVSVQYYVVNLPQHHSFDDTDSLRLEQSNTASSVSRNTIFDEFDDLTMAIKTLIRKANTEDIQFHADVTNIITEMKGLIYKATFVGGNILKQESSMKRKSSFKHHDDSQTSGKNKYRVSFREDALQFVEDVVDDLSDTSDDKNSRIDSFHGTNSEREWEHVMKNIEMRIEESVLEDMSEEGDAVFSLSNSFQRNKLLVALKTFRGGNGENITKEEAGDACIQYYFDSQSSVYKKIFDRYSFVNRFQCQKLERFFDLVDVQKDGTVTKEDFIEWGRRVSHSSGITFDSEIQRAFLTVYNSYFGNGTGESVEQWVEFIGMMSNLPNAIEMGANTAVKIFQAIDSNHDGHVSFNEFRVFIEALGLSSKDAEMSFRMIDKDGNGELSKKEVSEAFAHYLFDKEPSPAQNFFGPFFKLDSTRIKVTDMVANGTLGTEEKPLSEESIKKTHLDLSGGMKSQVDFSSSISDKLSIHDKSIENFHEDLSDEKKFEVDLSSSVSDKLKNRDTDVVMEDDEKTSEVMEDDEQTSEERLSILDVKQMVNELKLKEEESSRTAHAAFLKEEKRLEEIKVAFDELFSDWEGIRSQKSTMSIQ